MWTEEQAIELIAHYQSKPLLWNPKNPHYFRKNFKNEAWDDIAQSLKRDVEDCKNKIISLLSSYRRERARLRSSQAPGKSQDELYRSTWFAFEALQFLNGRKNPRKRHYAEVSNEDGGDASADSGETPELGTPTTSQAFKTKRKPDENKKLEMLSEALSVLKSVSISESNSDVESKHFSNFICSKMQKYEPRIKNSVQKEIMDIIFKADAGITNF